MGIFIPVLSQRCDNDANEMPLSSITNDSIETQVFEITGTDGSLILMFSKNWSQWFSDFEIFLEPEPMIL